MDLKQRLSRHLYDLHMLMDTEYADEVLNDLGFYQTILQHRMNFNAIRGISYAFHEPHLLNFIPPGHIIKKWEDDYADMRTHMIYLEPPGFDELITRMHVLQNRFQFMSMPGLLDKLGQLGLDRRALSTAITAVNADAFPENAKVEGAQIRTPANMNGRSFFLHFIRKNGTTLFEDITRQ
jgi:hypothetical protein